MVIFTHPLGFYYEVTNTQVFVWLFLRETFSSLTKVHAEPTAPGRPGSSPSAHLHASFPARSALPPNSSTGVGRACVEPPLQTQRAPFSQHWFGDLTGADGSCSPKHSGSLHAASEQMRPAETPRARSTWLSARATRHAQGAEPAAPAPTPAPAAIGHHTGHAGTCPGSPPPPNPACDPHT